MQPTDRAQSKTFVPPAFPSTQPTLDKHRVAVLPLQNISQDPQDEFFADGMTEELISTISMVSELQVISRTSIMQYKGGGNKKIGEIGRELNAGTLLEGSVRRAGTRLRIAVQLIDVLEDKHLWAQKYDRELTDVFAIQSEIAERVAKELKVQLLPKEKRRVEKRPTENTEAFELYLKGRYYWNERTKESLNKALGYFENAIEKDPGYARAYLGLAECYLILGDIHLSGNEAYPKAKALAAKALELDDSVAEAHATLASVLSNEWDWAGSEREFRLAIELSPSYATAHQWYGGYLNCVGRHKEGLAEIRKAQELDPLSPLMKSNIASTYLFERRYDEAINQYKQVLETDPNFFPARWPLALTYAFKSMFEEAMAEIQKAKALSPGDFSLNDVVAYVYAMSGRREDAMKVVDELLERSRNEYISPLLIALAYIGLGDKDRAFEWLEKAYEDRSGRLVYLKVNPAYDALRSDPRYVTLLRKMGLA